jgi:DNA polymerase-1
LKLTNQPSSTTNPTTERLLFDIEANGYNELVIDKKGNVVKEATEVHVMWIRNLDTKKDQVYKGDTILEGVKRLWAAAELNGHNIIQYDIPVLERITGLKRPAAQKVNDTLIRSRVLWPESFNSPMGGNSLADWGKWLGNKKGDFKGPWDKWSQEMEDYCLQDVDVNESILNKLATIEQNETAVRIEHEVTKIIARQTANGWGYDRPAAEKTIAALEIERAGIMDELGKMFPPTIETMKTPAYWDVYEDGKPVYRGPTKGAVTQWGKDEAKRRKVRKLTLEVKPGPMQTKEHPFNPASGMQVAERLKARYSWEPTEFTPTGEPKVDYDVLVKLTWPEAKLLLKYSDNEKLLEQVIDRFKRASLSRDHRIHGSVNVQGAVTGRMTHSQPNDAQVAKDKRVRCLYKPRPGWSLVGADASGLELRMLANRMGRYDGGAYGKVLLEGDIHTENQTAAGLPTRDAAKTFIYAFLYGAGDTKIGKVIGKGAKEGKSLKARFLTKLPALKKVIDAVRFLASSKGYVTLLDGRNVPCRSQHSALNTQLQGDGAIVMKVALIVLDKALQQMGLVPGEDYEFVANVHDEFQIECKPEHAEQIGVLAADAIKDAGRRLKTVIPLAGEYKIGTNWSETH